jgi:hypothetical protein
MTLPDFKDDLQVKANYSINQANEMVGKTVKSVQIGFQKTGTNVHQTEMLIITFTDDTKLAISTGSNVLNITSNGGNKLNPSDFHVDLDLTWQR